MVDVVFGYGKLATVDRKEPDFSLVSEAMYEAGEAVANYMRAALDGKVFQGMTRAVNRPNSAPFVQVSNSTFEFVVQTPEEVEQAVAPYDMKPGLLRGPRHRVTKEGQPYTIVPFTYKSEDLPGAVAQMASELTLSSVLGDSLEVRSDDQWEVMRNVYDWGANTGEQQNSRYSNMYKFGDDKYLTFRTVSLNSAANSWIHPGFPENPVSQSVWNYLEKKVTAHIRVGWRKALMSQWQ